MAITKSPDRTGHRFLLYGSPKAGKTYLACSTRSCVVVPVEEGLRGIPWEVPHVEAQPTSMRELVASIRESAEYARAEGLRHLVVDSLLGVERLVYAAAQASTGKSYSDAVDYGKLWRVARPIWGQLLDELDRVRRGGTNVWLLAHAQEEVAADPETGRQWRRLTIQVEGTQDVARETRTMLVAWSDHVLCLTRDITLRQAKGSRATAAIGERTLWCSDTYGACVAGNRASLPDELPGTWEALREALARGSAPAARAPVVEAAPAPAPVPAPAPAPAPTPAASLLVAEMEPAKPDDLLSRIIRAPREDLGTLAMEAARECDPEALSLAYERAIAREESIDGLAAIAEALRSEPLVVGGIVDAAHMSAIRAAYKLRMRELSEGEA